MKTEKPFLDTGWQRRYSAGKESMQFANVGVIISSPLFNLKEGKRTISVKIFITNTTGNTILSSAFEKMINDPSTFIINITGEEKWIPVNVYTITTNREGLEGGAHSYTGKPAKSAEYIKLNFMLNDDDLPIFPYKAAVHRGNYNLSYPALSLVLNNAGTYRVYPMFEDIKIDQINISAEVEDHRTVTLQNISGKPASTDPFQIFGPDPAPGMYIDILSSNIFNKYTNRFAINLEWLNLPPQFAGFEEYFREYDRNIKNESFRIKVGMVQNRNTGVSLKNQQEFHLFRTFPDQSLRSTTYIDVHTNIDFNNDLVALGATDDSLNNVGVRLTLTNPPEGFGQSIYTQVYSKIALENARPGILKSKNKLPNLPYIPTVKKISLNYTLTQNEVLSANNVGSEIELVHLYPFGYDHLHTEDNK